MIQDRVTIGPISLQLHIGWFEPERTVSQEILIELEFLTDTRNAALAEDLEQTIDYEIAQTLKQFTENKTYKLLETLVEDIATYCLSIKPVSQVTVRAKKRLPFDTRIIGGVEISRSN
jgi:FolB domain-containing protein